MPVSGLAGLQAERPIGNTAPNPPFILHTGSVPHSSFRDESGRTCSSVRRGFVEAEAEDGKTLFPDRAAWHCWCDGGGKCCAARSSNSRRSGRSQRIGNSRRAGQCGFRTRRRWRHRRAGSPSPLASSTPAAASQAQERVAQGLPSLLAQWAYAPPLSA